MRFVMALGTLVLHFAKNVLLSGWDTARVIIRDSDMVNSGTTRMSYGELDLNSASLLGALISLTPGTTMIAMDPRRRELVLHLLDLEQREETIANIQRDFVRPLLTLHGKRT